MRDVWERRSLLPVVSASWLLLSVVLMAGEDPPPQRPGQIIEVGRKSLVTVRQAGRTGRDGGVGSGFVVGEGGLIATNFHVIGEGRAVTVELPDGRQAPVTIIHATDRTLDIAVVKIDDPGLPVMRLGDSDAVPDGAALVALGAPQGLRASASQGALSARRELPEFPGLRMLQIAMPIEPGNSGGPVLDLEGRVQGLVTLRSLRTENLGFAVPVNALRILLDKPNPIPMSRWQTIGALDPRVWKPAAEGVHWSQRAGKIRAEGRGPGFGGRAVLLHQTTPPDPPYELAVHVKLGDESGAAGLAFGSDGAEKHYGFYPTNGALRLTRFDGPDVFSWSILAEVRPTNYRMGGWNELRVRVEPEKLTCFLNGEKVVDLAETCQSGQTGLCTFRESLPEFRSFRLGHEVAAPLTAASREGLLREAEQLETRAQQLRDEAAAAHEQVIERELLALVTKDREQEIDLIKAALVIARLDDPELEDTSYRERLVRLGEEFRASLGADADGLEPEAALARLNHFFFQENGFHGARFDYENLANSRLPEVLDDREGIPILLCLIYTEIGRAGGLDLVGLPRPLQFVVGLRRAGAELPLVIDVFEGGTVIDEPETAKLAPSTKREILTRMLTNLRSFSVSAGHRAAALGYASLLVALNPDEIHTRLARAALALDQKRPSLTAADLARLDTQTLDEDEASVVKTLRSALPAAP
jgi:serine protease Do